MHEISEFMQNWRAFSNKLSIRLGETMNMLTTIGSLHILYAKVSIFVFLYIFFFNMNCGVVKLKGAERNLGFSTEMLRLILRSESINSISTGKLVKISFEKWSYGKWVVSRQLPDSTSYFYVAFDVQPIFIFQLQEKLRTNSQHFWKFENFSIY